MAFGCSIRNTDVPHSSVRISTSVRNRLPSGLPGQLEMTRTQKRLLLGVAGLVVLIVMYAIEERVRGTMALRSWQSQMRAEGEKLSFEEIMAPVPTNPAVRVLTPQDAASFLASVAAPTDSPGAMSVLATGKARCVSQMDSWTNSDGRNITWSSLAPQLSECRQALADIRPTLTNRAYFVHLNYDEGFDLLLPHLAKHKALAVALSAATLIALHENNHDEAMANLVCFPAIVEACQREHLLIGDLVAIAVAHIGLAATWEALQTDGWTDTQLAAVQQAWQSTEFMRPYAHALEMERAVGAIYFDRNRYSVRRLLRLGIDQAVNTPSLPLSTPASIRGWWSEMAEPIAAAGDVARRFVGIALWAFAWREQDQLNHHQVVQSWIQKARCSVTSRHCAIPSTDDDEPGVYPHLAKSFAGLGRMRHWLSSMITPSLRSAAKAAAAESFRELALAACALKRHQLRHSQLPDSLEALVPELLPELPRDWHSGKPLRYLRRDTNTCLLYSVGRDGKDDGGDPRPPDPKQRWTLLNGRDLVWPEPSAR